MLRCLAALLLMTAVSATAEDHRERIAAACPQAAPARPQQERTLLVFTLTRGFRHSSIPVGVDALTELGRRTGAWRVVHSEDISVFEPESLRGFDAVCFLNTTGELFTHPQLDTLPAKEQAAAREREARLKKSLIDFISSGRGFAGIHAATDTFYQWPEFGAVIGGYFDGHPWHESVVIQNCDPSHPLNAALAGADLEIADEIYQIRDPYDRARQRVLTRLDTGRTNMEREGIRRKDGDFPVSWIKPAGRGRVFYCSLGHREEVYWNPKVLGLYLAGIQYALGDLAAEDTPIPAPAARAVRTASADGAVELFNGRDLSGWTCKPGSWVVEDGLIARGAGGDFLWSAEQYGDFVLSVDFRVSPKGNSGIFIRTGSQQDWLHTGIEIQVLDSHGKENPGKHDCGAVYDCVAPRRNACRPAGEWNTCVITCRGPRIEVVLNDEPIVNMNLDEWTEAGRNPDGTPNKFRTAYRDMPRRGYIGFQDHGNPVWFRNVRIRPLSSSE